MRLQAETQDVLDSVTHVAVIDAVHCRNDVIGNGLRIMVGKKSNRETVAEMVIDLVIILERVSAWFNLIRIRIHWQVIVILLAQLP
jgi:hypothetical protein